MILGEVFERFAQESPLTVMARGVVENALNPAVVDQLFEEVAEAQYTRKLLFSSVVDLMSLVVCRIKPAIHSAYKARKATVGGSLKAVYDQLDRIEPGLSEALVSTTARRLEPVIDAMGGARAPLLPAYRVRILDGNHLAATEHRIEELRVTRAGALPGQALVVLDPRTMLATDVVTCEDGHAQERSLLDRVLPLVAARDVWVDDRNFCTTDFLFGIAARQAFFVTRQHAATLRWEFAGQRRRRGRIETGEVFEQTIKAVNDAGEILVLRRITVELDQPARDGDRAIHLVTDLPRKDAPAKRIAELYRGRWTIETAFAELAETLNGEVETLGYPKAALFAFCVALVAYNVLSTVKAALRAVHGERRVAEEVSAYDVAEEVRMTHRGMMIAIPEDEWVVVQEMTPRELGAVLVELAGLVRMDEYRKSTRGPKKPPPKKQSGAKIKHVATAKILAARKECTT
jgi:IS4 transposase